MSIMGYRTDLHNSTVKEAVGALVNSLLQCGRNNKRAYQEGKYRITTSDSDSSNNRPRSSQDHRDFPRLHVEAKVRIAGTAESESEVDQPAILSDLSLGGARLSSPAQLRVHSEIGVIPFSGLLDDHPLHRILAFQVMWAGAESKDNTTDKPWREYGLAHQGSVLDVLNSWLGHLLLRRKSENEIIVQRREHRRFRFDERLQRPVRAKLSHDNRFFDLTLLDIAPGGLLARSESDEIPLGVHLELKSGWRDPTEESDLTAILGCVVDAHSHSGSTFYRVAFDPDSELDDDHLVNWAESVGGHLEG